MRAGTALAYLNRIAKLGRGFFSDGFSVPTRYIEAVFSPDVDYRFFSSLF
jgi:hypothetical protein